MSGLSKLKHILHLHKMVRFDRLGLLACVKSRLRSDSKNYKPRHVAACMVADGFCCFVFVSYSDSQYLSIFHFINRKLPVMC